MVVLCLSLKISYDFHQLNVLAPLNLRDWLSPFPLVPKPHGKRLWFLRESAHKMHEVLAIKECYHNVQEVDNILIQV